MKPQKNYKSNIEKRIITEDMLSDCLYSVNKRAKNCRDMIQKYRYTDYAEGYRERRDKYYSNKDTLLSLLNPIELHLERKMKDEYLDERYCDVSYLEDDEIIDIYNRWDKESQEYYSVYVVAEPIINVFALYAVGNRSFHHPLLFDGTEGQVDDIKKEYPDLPTKEIELITYGDNVTDLISYQFVKKVIDLIESGDYTYVPNSVDDKVKCA